MELKDFIKSTLTQIVDAVNECKQDIRSIGGEINPYSGGDRAQQIRSVRFDVAVTKTDKEGSRAGIGVLLGAFGIGAKGTAETEDRALSRIQFEIPLMVPPGRRVDRAS